jgi:hypothetical protein
MRQNADDFRLVVLNPGGADPEQHFNDGAGGFEQPHPPVNFHGFAACTRGYFHRDVQRAVTEALPVLLLLRGDFRASECALAELQKHGRKVVVSLKETGLDQIAQQLANRRVLPRFLRLVRQADGCLATTPETAEIYRLARGGSDDGRVGFIPTPYPLENKQWDFAVLPDKQTGIFIGTREWDIPSRNHFAAVLLARQLCETTGDPVTIVNLDGRKGCRLLDELKFPTEKLRLMEERKSYPDFLREMAQHKIILQLDRSHVPGQIAGDALLCRTVCVGGNGAIERIAFLRTCGHGRNLAELESIAQQLLGSASARAALVMESQWRGLERVSFSAVRTQLADFFARL